jgi:hypothetical protein
LRPGQVAFPVERLRRGRPLGDWAMVLVEIDSTYYALMVVIMQPLSAPANERLVAEPGVEVVPTAPLFARAL